MTDFKVGDTVEIIGNVHKGRMGKITERRDAAGTLWPWRVTYLSRNVESSYGIFHDDELKLVKPEPKFKKGDAVTVVTGTGLGMAGKTGTVTGKDSGLPEWPIEVSFGRLSHGYSEDELLKPVKQEFGTFLPDYAKIDAYLTSNLFANGGAPAFAKGGKVSKPEAVKHPAHYGGDTTYEAIKVIEAWGLGFNLGNAAKYLARAGKKGNKVEDLKKLVEYVQFEIAKEEAK